MYLVHHRSVPNGISKSVLSDILQPDLTNGTPLKYFLCFPVLSIPTSYILAYSIYIKPVLKFCSASWFEIQIGATRYSSGAVVKSRKDFILRNNCNICPLSLYSSLVSKLSGFLFFQNSSPGSGDDEASVLSPPGFHSFRTVLSYLQLFTECQGVLGATRSCDHILN